MHPQEQELTKIQITVVFQKTNEEERNCKPGFGVGFGTGGDGAKTKMKMKKSVSNINKNKKRNVNSVVLELDEVGQLGWR